MKMTRFKIWFVLILLLLGLTSCASLEPFKSSKAALGPKTPTNIELSSLPDPKEKIVAAVYKFRDQTGQYKNSSVSSSFSTAVTQGATSILIKALEDSKWFIPIEREGLSDLLNERKIVRSSRENFLGEEGKKLPELPPLLYAGIILEGGIISYDSNVLTGGEGIQYFGISASGQYRQDRITIYLRAISTQNGRVLKTVYTTKTILSQLIDIGVYRYVDYNTLLQAETGVSYNEPTDICVTQAIEKAVQSLIIEGVVDGLWQLKDAASFSSAAIQNYFKEKSEGEKKDYLGRRLTKNRGLVGLNLNVGGQKYSGDYNNQETNTAAGLSLRIKASDKLFLGLSYHKGRLSAKNSFNSNFHSIDARGDLYLLNEFSITPYLIFGGGVIFREDSRRSQSYPISLDSYYYPSLLFGCGLEYLAIDNVGLNLELTNHYTLGDKLDGITGGKYFDYIWSLNFGINFYFGNW